MSDATVERTEDVQQAVAQLGIERSLLRRYARLDEVQALWRPPSAESEQPNTAKPPNLPVAMMSWARFATIIMPDAEAMELYVPEGMGAFIALHTAVDPDAPPILKWDRPQERNPMGWYIYPNFSLVAQWKLSAGFTRINAIATLPSMWGLRPMPSLGEGVVLILEGAVDTNQEAQLGLFPENLRPELYETRAAIEALSKAGRMQGREAATACGWDLRRNGFGWPVNVRVLNPTGWTVYRLDRWT